MSKLALAALAASALTGCVKDAVVVTPIAPRPVASTLLVVPEVPRCALHEARDYAPEEVKAYAQCWRAAYDALFVRHKGLIKAVMVRERAAAKAVAAAKS